MSAESASPENTGSQNPYAILSSQSEDPADLHRRKNAGETAGGLELPITSASVKRQKVSSVDYLRAPSGNPYAMLASYDEDPVDLHLRKMAGEKAEELEPLPTAVPVEHQNKRQGISKKEFQDGCRRVFLLYIPAGEGQTLRPHYRDFISRNENDTPEYRGRLLTELGKYDLSSSGDFKPHFNREEELFTIAKLHKIEQTAKID